MVHPPRIDNLSVYNNEKTVEYYNNLIGLQACEKFVFSKYVLADMSILDIGVGGGRTTPHLLMVSNRYIGVDYSSAMIDVCRKKFPLLPFHTVDASDLSLFHDNQFDIVVFSFNGIDYLYPDVSRFKCLDEINRVLKSNGKFIFSVHNPRHIFVRPQFHSVGIIKKVWRLLRVLLNISLVLRQLCRSVFWNGIGYITDSVHGKLLTHTSIPRFVKEELNRADFQLLEIVSGSYPISSGEYTSPWYYYVAQKIDGDES